MGFLVSQKITLECSHLVFAEQRGILAEPDIPHHILATLLFLWIHGIEALPHIAFQNLVQALSFIRASIDADRLQASVIFERHAAMIEKIIIVDFVKSSLAQKEAHMTLQLFAV